MRPVHRLIPVALLAHAVSAVVLAQSQPLISSISPNTAVAGGPAFTLTVNGSSFFECSAAPCLGVNWQPSSGGSTFIFAATSNGNGTQITVNIPASLIASPDTVAVGVTSQTGTTPPSGDALFTITQPLPFITGLSPPSATAGGPAFTLTVNGSSFVDCPDGCLGVDWIPSSGGGVFISATANADGTQLTVAIPSNLIATVGTASVSVEAVGGTSNSVTFTITVPPPTITSISPPSTPAGTASAVLTLTGTGYASFTSVQFNGVALPTSFVSATQVTAVVSASSGLLTNPGTALVTAANGNAVSLPIAFAVTSPVITSLSPSSKSAGSPQFNLTVNGSSFVPASVVLWSGSPLVTTYVSASLLQAVVPASLLVLPGTATVTVRNTPTALSAGAAFTIGPPLLITSLQPNAAVAGQASFTLTVTGSGFLQGAVVLWNASPLTTTFALSTSLTATVPANLVAAKGSALIAVRNPDGSASNSLPFAIGNPPPAISSISPSTVPAGAAGFTLAVAGTGFMAGAIVEWNTTSLATTFGSATQLSAVVPASLVAQPGAVSISVVNPDGTGSNQVAFTIANPLPAISGLSPSTAVAGGGDFTLMVSGANFLSGAVVQWNGGNLSTTFGGATQLSATVTASLIAKAGTASITVANPDGQVSGPATFSIVSPPAITSLNPNAVDAAGAAFTLTVNGSAFVSGAVVSWNGSALATTFVGVSQLTATVTAALIANPGTASVSVINPDGAASPSVTFTVRVPVPPPITFSGPSTAPPATGQNLAFSLGGAYPFPIAGQMTLGFQPDAVNPIGTDPAIQFATGGTSFTFTIAANSTAVPSVSIQTGSTAGTITVSVQLQSAGQAISVPDVTIQIPRAAPVIQKAQLTQTASGLQVDVTGYATPREVTQATFHFVAAPGVTLATSDFTVAVTPAFTTWYQGQGSQPFGSQFTYSQPFSVQGSAQAVSSVTVTLSNSVGASQPLSSN